MILIYGKGKVGLAIAELCRFQGISYEICDDSNDPRSYGSYELIIPSPGVPSSHPIYKTGKVMSELDFAYQFLPKDFQIISVTGTDGKSTTAWIMYSIVEKEFSVKKPVYLSGNFDIPFSSTVLEIIRKGEKKGIIVVEISSFMAFGIEKYQSDYSIFTNFKPDHLNWHQDLQEYLDAKMNLIQHTRKISVINNQVIQFIQQSQLNVVLPIHVRVFQEQISRHLSQTQTDSVEMTKFRDSTDGENIKISGRKTYVLSDTHFSGIHNAMNILACALVANEMGICSKRTREYLKTISGLPHRLEIIGKKRGITMVEDSKSTSSQSLSAALGSFGNTRNLLLIVGGSDKGDSFAYLAPLFQSRVTAMVCIGATKEQFIDIAKQEHIPYLSTDNLIIGVDWLYQQGSSGDILILSPGCASFGLFLDYFDRANQFREVIKNLSE